MWLKSLVNSGELLFFVRIGIWVLDEEILVWEIMNIRVLDIKY
jgi:hypothetical protein